ncbi:hypothetical protein [Olleya sp. R77988]|uniref:hypothetical protein n=1 Tax=Olleya sp. R77988 TaxID=3093875 RepID=UPI0037C95EF7
MKKHLSALLNMLAMAMLMFSRKDNLDWLFYVALIIFILSLSSIIIAQVKTK